MTKETQYEYKRFMTVTDILELWIRRGQIQSGKPFLNRAEICEQFKISPVTAHKVQRELASRGLISSRNGRPFMVCDPTHLGLIPLRKIRLLRQVPAAEIDHVMDAISAGARKACEKHHLEFQEEFVELLDKDSRKMNTVGDCEEGQGIILHPYKEMMLRNASYFLKYWFHRVTIDNTLPDTPGVLVDSVDGLFKLFEQAQKNGVRKMLILPSAAGWQVSYISERLHLAQRLAPQFGIQIWSNLYPEFERIVEDIRNIQPDAVLVLYDDNFDELQEVLSASLPEVPPYYVFARNMVPRPDCICYETDYKVLGAAAVEELIANVSQSSHVFLRYVPGKLKVPNKEKNK